MLRGRPLANCCCNVKFVDHLLHFCPIAHSLWTYMFRCLGSIGSCQVQLWTYYFVGIIGLGSIVLIFGIWFQAV